MEKNLKKILLGVAAVAFIAVFAFMMLYSDLKHIEDTNGPDSYKLTTITDADIISMDMGALTPCTVRDALIGDGINFSSDKFTGVYEVLYTNYVLPSDFYVSINTLHVTEGNLRMVVVNDGKIVAEITPNSEDLIQEIHLENLTGYVSLRIAGESASYSFQMSPLDYDMFEHP